MDPKERKVIEGKRAELRTLLFELAKNETLLRDPKQKREVYLKLEDIYEPKHEERFRHFYSDFFPILVEINDDVRLGHISVLLQNLSILMDGYAAKNFDEDGEPIDIRDCIIKLYDHINLDAARLSYHTVIREKTQDDLNKINKRIDNFNETLKINEDRIKKAETAEKNYITILGIFASIVLAFTGGIAFSTSVLENIDAVSPYRLAAVVIGLAFVLTNVVYILVRFIQEINKEKNEKVKYPIFMVVLNAVLIAALVATIVCWFKFARLDEDTPNAKYSVSMEYNIEQPMNGQSN